MKSLRAVRDQRSNVTPAFRSTKQLDACPSIGGTVISETGIFRTTQMHQKVILNMATPMDGACGSQKYLRPTTQEKRTGIRPAYFLPPHPTLRWGGWYYFFF